MARNHSTSNDRTLVDWPEGFERTPPSDRVTYPHGFRVDRQQAFENILTQLERLGAEQVLIDTAVDHKKSNPNIPYADATADDPGVVARYVKDGQQYAVPCDSWDNLRDNAQAIAKYLDAKRALDRYGVETIGDEFMTQIESQDTLIDQNRDRTAVFSNDDGVRRCQSCDGSLAGHPDIDFCPHCGHTVG